MDSESLRKKLSEFDRNTPPPNCVNTFLPHPQYGESKCVEIGIVQEHRFAFCFWIKNKIKQMRLQRLSDENFLPPDLVTWDWHNDFGADSDLDIEMLQALDQTNEAEVAMFSWTGLCLLNDGQILPALWLNAIGNVYIIQRQVKNTRTFRNTKIDRYGNSHEVFYFRNHESFAEMFAETSTGGGVVWDVDMDYFTSGRGKPDQKYTKPLANKEITEMLDGRHAWMRQILRDLQVITIALEPEYTGGLSISNRLFECWETALFARPVFSRNCKWKKGLFKDV
jgi:hypothetical protein